MTDRDTNLGGPPRAFPKTTLGLTEALRQPSRPEHQAGLATLCERYWKPVYGYVRIAWRKSNEDAKDLTQAFFAWLLESGVLERFDPALGSFRGYLKVLLRRFVGHEEAALGALKRGGGIKVVPLEGTESIFESALAAGGGEDPEKMFERVWLIDRLIAALARVRARCEGGPRGVAFRVYEGYDLVSPSERPTYKALAESLGLEERDIKNHLLLIREEVRREVLADLDLGAGGETRLHEDWNAVFGS
jgi:RNA polymerase sigma-70 factor (ECF subfamily)